VASSGWPSQGPSYPKAQLKACPKGPAARALLEHVIDARHHSWRDDDAEGARDLEVQRELDLLVALDWYLPGRNALRELLHEPCRVPASPVGVIAVKGEPSRPTEDKPGPQTAAPQARAPRPRR